MRVWCRRFECTVDQLKAAVSAVGPSPEWIGAYLDIKRKVDMRLLGKDPASGGRSRQERPSGSTG